MAEPQHPRYTTGPDGSITIPAGTLRQGDRITLASGPNLRCVFCGGWLRLLGLPDEPSNDDVHIHCVGPEAGLTGWTGCGAEWDERGQLQRGPRAGVLLTVPADDETAAVVEAALADPRRHLGSERFDLTQEQWTARAVVAALLAHSQGLGLSPWPDE